MDGRSAAHTPARFQPRGRRSWVMPESHPTSAARYSQGKPVLSTNKMPVSAARAGTGGWPGRGRSGGSNGAITAPDRQEATAWLRAQIGGKLLGFQVVLGVLGKRERLMLGLRPFMLTAFMSMALASCSAPS